MVDSMTAGNHKIKMCRSNDKNRRYLKCDLINIKINVFANSKI